MRGCMPNSNLGSHPTIPFSWLFAFRSNQTPLIGHNANSGPMPIRSLSKGPIKHCKVTPESAPSSGSPHTSKNSHSTCTLIPILSHPRAHQHVAALDDISVWSANGKFRKFRLSSSGQGQDCDKGNYESLEQARCIKLPDQLFLPKKAPLTI